MIPAPATTEAAVLFETAHPLRLLRLTLPPLNRGQVLVKLAYSGVCHTQVLEVAGKRGVDRFLPHTLGHEGSGTVLAVGENVTKVRPGDPVVLSWIKGSGSDVPSVTYQSEHGPINSGAISTFMRHTIASENRVTRVPPQLPLRVAALLGCAVPTGAGILLNTAGAGTTDTLAVFGVGGIGLSALLAGTKLNCAKRIAIDVEDAKLAAAARMGATQTINATQLDPVTAIMEATGGRGVDLAIESAGKRETMEAAFRAVRTGGGLCVIAGNLPFGESIEIDPFELIKGRRIVGTWGGETSPDRDIPRFAQWFLEDQWPIDGLVSHDFPLDEINVALQRLEKRQLTRALIRFDDQPD